MINSARSSCLQLTWPHLARLKKNFDGRSRCMTRMGQVGYIVQCMWFAYCLQQLSFTKKHLFLFINPCLAELTCDCLSDRLHRTKGDDRNNWDSLSDGGSSKGLSKHSNLLFLKSPLLGISGRSSSVNLQHSWLWWFDLFRIYQCFQVHIFLETFILYFIYDFTETVLSGAQCVGLKIKS